MEYATEKQVVALQSFAKVPKLNENVLHGRDFEGLSKSEASELISACIEQREEADEKQNSYKHSFSARFSQKYRNIDGSYTTVTLTDEELSKVRSGHEKHIMEVWHQIDEMCPEAIYSEEYRIAVFSKMCDKIFTHIQTALFEKYQASSNGNHGKQNSGSGYSRGRHP